VNSNNTISITMNLAGQTTAQTYASAVSEAGNEAVGIETGRHGDRNHRHPRVSFNCQAHRIGMQALTEFIQPPVEAVEVDCHTM